MLLSSWGFWPSRPAMSIGITHKFFHQAFSLVNSDQPGFLDDFSRDFSRWIFPFWETPKISQNWHRKASGDSAARGWSLPSSRDFCWGAALARRGAAVSRDSGEVPRKVAICSWLFPKKIERNENSGAFSRFHRFRYSCQIHLCSSTNSWTLSSQTKATITDVNRSLNVHSI